MKFISNKPKYKITQTETIQLVSYGVRNVFKNTDTFPPSPKKKQIEKRKQYAATDIITLQNIHVTC